MDRNKEKTIAQNKKAFHDFFIEETHIAGIVLTGTEVKSIRKGSVSLKDAFARIENGEAYLFQMHIAPYAQGNRFNHEPLRTRKLLLKKAEIMYLLGATKEQGYTLVPTKLFIKNGFAKIEIGLAKGKKMYDKRESAKKRDAEREIRKALREKEKLG